MKVAAYFYAPGGSGGGERTLCGVSLELGGQASDKISIFMPIFTSKMM